MSLPTNIRVNIAAPFPSRVKASAPLTIAKANSIWTVGLNIANLGALPAGTDPAAVEVLLYNTVLHTFQQTTLAAILQSFSLLVPTNIGIANSPYPVLLSDSLVYVDSSGGPVVVDLPLAALRQGRAIAIKDISGNAAAHNITIIPSGIETIEGLNPLAINSNYGGFRLNPVAGKYVIAP
jgi:hypothetical protein